MANHESLNIGTIQRDCIDKASRSFIVAVDLAYRFCQRKMLTVETTLRIRIQVVSVPACFCSGPPSFSHRMAKLHPNAQHHFGVPILAITPVLANRNKPSSSRTARLRTRKPGSLWLRLLCPLARPRSSSPRLPFRMSGRECREAFSRDAHLSGGTAEIPSQPGPVSSPRTSI